jgi:hypothetical protein
MRQDLTTAFEAFIERKWLDALNAAAAEPASWKGDGEKATPGAQAPDRAVSSGKGTLRVTGAVNVVEQGDSPRSPSPLWELSFGRKCRARNLIGCDGDHVMVQCEKLMSLGLAERKEVLEKSGLCMFCLKHAAELECYGRGGMSKPRCTQSGCDGEHTPSVHKLMGEESAGMNLIAGDGSEEDEDEGWWVGTVGVMEMPDQVEEVPNRMFRAGREREGCCAEAGSGDRIEEGPGYPLSDCSADEAAEDEWWGLGSTQPNPGRGGAGAQRPPADAAWSPCPVSAKRRKLRKRPETTVGQDLEEARRNAWLRQMLSDTSSDEDEERYGRFAESGRWMTELFEIPQQPALTSGGECSG